MGEGRNERMEVRLWFDKDDGPLFEHIQSIRKGYRAWEIKKMLSAALPNGQKHSPASKVESDPATGSEKEPRKIDLVNIQGQVYFLVNIQQHTGSQHTGSATYRVRSIF